MAKLVGTVRVRNERRVYFDATKYIVAHIDSKGIQHRYEIPATAIERLQMLGQGETLTKDDAADRIHPFATRLGLSYEYGWKLSFLALEMLVVLVALGRAHMSKQGNRFYFSIH